jgi:hypothetical protein
MLHQRKIVDSNDEICDVMLHQRKIVDSNDEICDVKTSKFAIAMQQFNFSLSSTEGIQTLSHLANLHTLRAGAQFR